MNESYSRSEMSRRQFVQASAAGCALLVIRCAGGSMTAGVRAADAAGAEPSAGSPIALPPLPFATNALEPHISDRTVGIHYGKHHQGYVNKINKLVQGTEFSGISLEEIIKRTSGVPDREGVFNNAAQTWNHTFYWNSMKPGGGGEPSGKLAEMMITAFGSLDDFKKRFSEASATQFGSGWAWLVLDGGNLEVVKTSNADTPLAHGQIPLLAIDVWEHAYYLDYQNQRKEYIDVWLEHLVNWDFALANLS